MAKRQLKLRLKLCREIWREIKSSRRARAVTAAYAVLAVCFTVANYVWPELSDKVKRVPKLNSFLSWRVWIIVGLIIVIIFIVEGAYRVKRKKLAKQAKAHRNEISRWRSDVDHLRGQLNGITGRPRLTGFFQGFQVYSYGEDSEELSEDGKAIIFVPGFERPLGVEVVLKFRMVNENSTPTTLHNFNLKMTYFDQEGFAKHADEWVYEGISEKERAILWEQNERRFADNEDAEKRCPNLVSYLRDHEMAQGKALEGGVVFRFPGIKFVEGRVGDKPTLILKLGIEDAWGVVHYIERWGPKSPPLPRRVKSATFW